MALTAMLIVIYQLLQYRQLLEELTHRRICTRDLRRQMRQNVKIQGLFGAILYEALVIVWQLWRDWDSFSLLLFESQTEIR